MSVILSAEGLCIGYGDKTVVSDITFAAESGCILCLIGPNGAGKSTLLKTLIRLLPPKSGAVMLEDRKLQSYRERDLARVSAAMLTGRTEPELMSCGEVVASGRYPYTGKLGILSEEDRRVVRESMKKVGIEQLEKNDFSRISDGQRQRVLLARAICQQPRLLILDEPTSYLDIRHKLEFLTLLRRLAREEQIAVVMSMHELELAQRFADRLLCIRDGRIDRAGSPEEIFTGSYVEQLYGMKSGRYLSLSGTVEAPGEAGTPKVFVIGGGGSGIPVYRQLQRARIPFAAGVYPENDIDVPVARALAELVITGPMHEPVSTERADEAMETLKDCDRVICTASFGSVNMENHRLLEYARAKGKLCELRDLLETETAEN